MLTRGAFLLCLDCGAPLRWAAETQCGYCFDCQESDSGAFEDDDDGEDDE